MARAFENLPFGQQMLLEGLHVFEQSVLEEPEMAEETSWVCEVASTTIREQLLGTEEPSQEQWPGYFLERFYQVLCEARNRSQPQGLASAEPQNCGPIGVEFQGQMLILTRQPAPDNRRATQDNFTPPDDLDDDEYWFEDDLDTEAACDSDSDVEHLESEPDVDDLAWEPVVEDSDKILRPKEKQAA